MSYWPMVADALRKDWLPRLLNASELARANPDDFWFTYNDTVLRWRWPIGLAYDFCHARTLASDGQAPIPWSITVHLSQAKPDAKASLDQCHASYMARLKEADYLLWGSCKRTLELPREQQDRLWKSVCAHECDAYNDVMHTLRGDWRDDALDPSAAVSMRRLPVSFYVAPHGAPVVQEPMPPTHDGNALTTLRMALERSFPTGPLPTALLHGIVLPADTPLAYLARSMSYLDGWLHIIVMDT